MGDSGSGGERGDGDGCLRRESEGLFGFERGRGSFLVGEKAVGSRVANYGIAGGGRRRRIWGFFVPLYE